MGAPVTTFSEAFLSQVRPFSLSFESTSTFKLAQALSEYEVKKKSRVSHVSELCMRLALGPVIFPIHCPFQHVYRSATTISDVPKYPTCEDARQKDSQLTNSR